MLYRHIGEAVRRRRRELELTQEGLAERLDISRASLANIETGRQRILIHHLYSLARALGQEITALLPASHELDELMALDGLEFSAGVNLEQKLQVARILREQEESTHTGGDDEKGGGETAIAGSSE